ncbi:MAG: D-lyxose/D-mannose family sugar isomerase [Kiloniella sp.]|nr:D-lyxose/D-mannose family sugar isomerase [Kiloniella sp.]
MRRAEINEIIKQAQSFIEGFGYVLPPFAHWTPEDWNGNHVHAGAIIDAALGWDITDYGLGKFEDTGLFLFTVRNGNAADLKAGRGMLYAEKIMISRREQLSPMHYHRVKAEDIINRGGGMLVVELYHREPEGEGLDLQRPVTVFCDGVARRVDAGGRIALAPGESVTLLPTVYHAFWGEGDDVLIGEVSTVNDDRTDNYFLDKLGRFPDIEEDEQPFRLLVKDY